MHRRDVALGGAATAIGLHRPLGPTGAIDVITGGGAPEHPEPEQRPVPGDWVDIDGGATHRRLRALVAEGIFVKG